MSGGERGTGPAKTGAQRLSRWRRRSDIFGLCARLRSIRLIFRTSVGSIQGFFPIQSRRCTSDTVNSGDTLTELQISVTS